MRLGGAYHGERLRQWFRQNEAVHFFIRSPAAVASAAILLLLFLAAAFAPCLAAQDPRSLGQIDLMNSSLPPFWSSDGLMKYPLGTDAQGRDVLSVMLYGLRLSLMVGFLSVLISFLIGTLLGLVAAYRGGILDAIIMRLADVQLAFPAMLVAILLNGIARGAVSRETHAAIVLPIIISSIGISYWVQYGRTARGLALVEMSKDYVSAARVIGTSAWQIVVLHILPNAVGPLLVLATINLGLAIITEATLSFLGMGLPPTNPSLGTLIRYGNEFLFSGEWWIVVFPGIALMLLVLSINLLGDWLRDTFNPRLR